MRSRALNGILMMIVALGAMAPMMAVSDIAPMPVPNVLIDGAPWPRSLTYPIKKVRLSVYVPGAPEFVSSEEQERIERLCADFLADKMKEVAPGIVVIARSAPTSEEDSRDPATVWAYYNIWLEKWTDVETKKETVLGVSMLSIHAAALRGDTPVFAPGVFQTTRDANAVSAAVQESVNRHMITAIVAPLEASLRQ